MGRTTAPATSAMPTLDDAAPRISLKVRGMAAVGCKDLSKPVILVGGRRDCDLSIQHSEISQVHCAIVNTGRDVIVADLSSRSGTFVNEKRVTVAPLNRGDRLRVGVLHVDVSILGGPGQRGPVGADPTRLPTPLKLTGVQHAVELTHLPAVIGRRAACPVVIDNPDVSLAHALLLTIGGCPALFDLGSRSGTYVNGRRVGLTWLHDGDEIAIGGVVLRGAWQGHVACDTVAASPAVVSMPPPAPNPPAPPTVPAALQPPDRTLTASIGADEIEALLAALQSHVTLLRDKLRERSTELDHREVELQVKGEAFASESTRFEERERQIQAREEDLAKRLREIEHREELAAETERRIEHFKSALNAASQRLAGFPAPLKIGPDAPVVERPMFGVLSVAADASHAKGN